MSQFSVFSVPPVWLPGSRRNSGGIKPWLRGNLCSIGYAFPSFEWGLCRLWKISMESNNVFARSTPVSHFFSVHQFDLPGQPERFLSIELS